MRALLSSTQKLVSLDGHEFMLAGGQEVDIVRVVPGPHEFWAVAASGGDANSNGVADVTPNGTVRLPFLGNVPLPSHVIDAPVDHVLALMTGLVPAAAAIPGVGQSVSVALSEFVTIARVVLKK